jgi:stage II sporulation protein D
VLILLLCSGSTVVAAMQPPEKIRVAVLSGGKSITLDGERLIVVDESGRPLRLSFPAVITKEPAGLAVAGMPAQKLTASAPTAIKVNGKRYRGIIEVLATGKGLLVVNELPLEEYLVGLINCEISSLWPMETVKAQAVIARSYALFQREIRKDATYHLESSVLDQVYDGCNIEDSRSARGVSETAGEVLTFDGAVIQAFYHSVCGGHTEAPENVWGFHLPYVKSVECSYCRTAPAFRWQQTLSLHRLESFLQGAGYKCAALTEIKLGAKNRSDRVEKLILVTGAGEIPLTATAFRKAVGYEVIKSTNFAVKRVGSVMVFSGLGNGHGVGFCQWGAKNMALKGASYREILSHYYPAARLEKRYGE